MWSMRINSYSLMYNLIIVVLMYVKKHMEMKSIYGNPPICMLEVCVIFFYLFDCIGKCNFLINKLN